MLHPLNQQCEAKAKATGQRCERRVVGGTVCYVHGGNAKQVKAKREQRVAVAEARAAAAAEPVVLQRAEPEEVLIDLLDDVTRILAQIKSELHGNVVSPVLLAVAGEWFDRTARIAKVLTDGDLATKLHARMGWLAEDRSAVVWAHLSAILQASTLTAADKLVLWQAKFDGLRLIANGDLPFRLSADELHRFSDRLLEEAAREQAAAQAAADGVGWPEPGVDGDSGDGVPYLFAVDGSGNGLSGDHGV